MLGAMLRASAALLVFACALPAQAGLFSDDEVRPRIDVLRTQVDTLRTQLDDMTGRLESVTKNQVDFSNQIEAVKSDIAKLRGRIEELTYNLNAVEQRQKDFYIDLDNRLRKLESQGQVQAEDAKAAEAAAMSNYEAALTALKNSDCKSAVAGFESFIKGAPESPQQPSANFFAAYCYSHLKQPAKAAELYGHLIETWPDDDHVPDAMLGRADSLEDLKLHKEARSLLASLADKYPKSEAGKEAKTRLKKK